MFNISDKFLFVSLFHYRLIRDHFLDVTVSNYIDPTLLYRIEFHMTLYGHIALVNNLINTEMCVQLTIPFVALSMFPNRWTLQFIFQ